MANDEFMTLDQVCQALDRSEDQIKALVQQGQLSEVRDAGHIYYRRSQVEQLKAKEGSSVVDLDAGDEAAGVEVTNEEEGESFASALSSLADSSSGMGILDESPMAGPEESSVIGMELADAADAAGKQDEQQQPQEQPQARQPAESEQQQAQQQETQPETERQPADTGVEMQTQETTADDSSPVIEMVEEDETKPQAEQPAELTLDDIPEELPAAPTTEQDPGFSSEIDLVPGDDSKAGTSFGLSDSVLAGVEDATGKKDSGEDEIPDLGLSGSSIISLEGSGLEDTGMGTGMGDTGMGTEAPAEKDDDTKITQAPAISVFDDDELEGAVDPMGETQLASGVDDLEAVGSGSGLLDLTRESDDTSLGAELLDVISPSEAAETADADSGVLEAAETIEDDGSAAMTVEEPLAAVEAEETAVPAAAPRAAAQTVEMAGAVPMNVTAFLGILALAALGLSTAAAIQGVWPAFLDHVAGGVINWSVFGGLALIAIVTGVLSILAGRK